jgi:formylglycine-generating enzyme required for sulfatase activity
MADIFISYAREDVATAQALAAALEDLGWSVFWDRRIPAGRRFDEFIAEQLEAARCVLVLWSKVSITSAWVKEEAADGRDRGILVPARLTDVMAPLGFRAIQAADLIGWRGDGAYPGFTQLTEDIAGLAGPPPKRLAEEEAARRRAEEAEAKGKAEAEARRKSEQEEAQRQRAEAEAEERRKAQEERQRAEAEARRKAEAAEGKPAEAEANAGQPASWLLRGLAGVAVLVVIAGVALWQADQEEPKPLPGERPRANEPAPAPQPPAKPTAATAAAGKPFQDCDVCPVMVPLPEGSFLMGSPKSEAGRDDDEGPQHRVTIGRPFALGKHEVTFAEWDACVRASGCDGYRPDDAGWGRGKRPVIKVSWRDAQAYVAWLAKTTGKAYRLPSEAEWEYAARAGTTTRYSFGDELTEKHANFGGHMGKTTEVGAYPANPWGLHDMHGNVWEWVADVWHDSYQGAPADGSAWTDGEGTNSSRNRVGRGGSWSDYPGILRSASRGRGGPVIGSNDLGFRVARTLY